MKKKYRESKVSQAYAIRLTPENHQYLIQNELRDEVRELITLAISNHRLAQLPVEPAAA